MTYKEKYLEEYPKEVYRDFETALCPDDGNRPNYCPIDVDVDDSGEQHARCKACWDREVPEEDKVSMKEACEIYDELVKAAYGGPSTKELSESLDLRESPHIKDSGNRREFESGAVRDIQEGKGRCDLLPLDVVGYYYNDSEVLHKDENPKAWVFYYLARFTEDGDVNHLSSAISKSLIFENDETMFLEVAKHFEEGCKKYGENNWRKGIPTHCYIDSAVRHYLKFLRGDRDEPHDRAFVWNIMCCIWTCKHKPELNDYRKEGECKDDANGKL